MATYDISGEIVNTNLNLIHDLLQEKLEGVKLRLKNQEELFIENEDIYLNIYEYQQEKDGNSYLLGGAIDGSITFTKDVLNKIAQLLTINEIKYNFEFSEESTAGDNLGKEYSIKHPDF